MNIMKKLGVAALGLLLGTAIVASEDTKPDFSGTWIFNPARSGLEMHAPTKSVFVIEHRDPVFKVTRTHTWSDRSDTLTFEFTTDGMEHHLKEGNWESWTRMTWMGEELVLDMKIADRGEQGTNVVHYRLADGGKVLIAAEWYHMPRKQHHNYWYFDRAQDE